MPAVAGVGLPTLSQIRAWDISHLELAARDWASIAEHWDDSFEAVQRETLYPGGTVWEGAGAEAAQERAFGDVARVRSLTHALYEASGLASRGADNLSLAKLHVRDAVEEAESAGYTVGEDLSVTPRAPGLLAEAQARGYAAHIARRAALLVSHDQEIASQITATTAPLHGVVFDEPGGPAGDV